MTDSMVFWILYLLLAVMTLGGFYLLYDNKRKAQRILVLEGKHLRATQHIAYLAQFQDRLVQGVMILIEKTDWMTGRWGGRFNELVALEKQRNAAVDLVRKRLWDVPEIHEYIQNPRNQRTLVTQLGRTLSGEGL